MQSRQTLLQLSRQTLLQLILKQNHFLKEKNMFNKN